jgi:hypothetical protein
MSIITAARAAREPVASLGKAGAQSRQRGDALSRSRFEGRCAARSLSRAAGARSRGVVATDGMDIAVRYRSERTRLASDSAIYQPGRAR